MRIRVSLIVFLILLFAAACTHKKKGTVVEFNLKHARDKIVYIRTIPSGNDPAVIEDSARLESGDAHVRLKLKEAEEGLYELRVSGTDIRIRFVNDTDEINITGNLLNPHESTIEKSKVNAVLRSFLRKQELLSAEGNGIAGEINRLKSTGASPSQYDSLQRLYNQKMESFFSAYRSFADTVSSPGAFLFVYNNVDFGKDYDGLRKFIQRAEQRFPNHSRIKKLYNETLEFLKVFEEEFQPGQQLPSLQLPDISNNIYNTSLSAGKYVFIDFWSTWCGPCIAYDDIKKKMFETYSQDQLQLISIALDTEKDNWRAYIAQKKYNWIQLIDEKMWKGEVIRRWRIDSIPYNLLLDPKGIILRKAIPRDSVEAVLSQYIK